MKQDQSASRNSDEAPLPLEAQAVLREFARYGRSNEWLYAQWARIIRSEQLPSEQGAEAIALVALLGDTAPIRRWKEYEDRGEERIPCFIAVETAKAIAEFFPKSNERNER